MIEKQESSLPYLTTACTTLLFCNIIVFPVKALWTRVYPKFQDLPEPLHQRHDVNTLTRVILGPMLLPVEIYCAVNTMQDHQWFLENRELVSVCVLVYLILDLFELTQRRRFEWQPWAHHTFQTIVGLYFLEWGDDELYSKSFPNIGIVIFSSLHKLSLVVFPLSHVVATSGNTIRLTSKFCFVGYVLSPFTGFAVELGLIFQHKDQLTLPFKIGLPITFIVFNLIDIPLYKQLYMKAFCTNVSALPL